MSLSSRIREEEDCLQKVKICQQTKFRRHISIYGWDVTTSVFEKQTSAILEFYFRFRSRPLRRNLYFIPYQITEFRPNRSTRCENMTSYPFLKMAAATAQYYFWFRICWCRICWCHCLQKVKIYQQTKFRRHISIHGFRYWKTKCMPYWNYTSGFDLDYFAVIGEILHPRVPNFVQIRTYTAEIWRHVDFQDGGRQPYCICFEVMADHPRSFSCSELDPQIAS